MAGPSDTEKSLFDKLVQDLSTSLGPESGLTTVSTDVERLTDLMARYSSRESDWQSYAFADLSRAYTRNLVDTGNGRSNLVSENRSPSVKIEFKYVIYTQYSSSLSGHRARAVPYTTTRTLTV